MAISREIYKAVESTPFVDTHEHTWEESLRVEAKNRSVAGVPAPDIGMLFAHYADSDLVAAGLEPDAVARLHRADVDPHDKWAIIEPYYEAARNTGYLQTVRATVQALYNETDLFDGNVQTVSERIAGLIQPGYYQYALKTVAGIEYAQVNALGDDAPVFRQTEQPDLLCQDLSFVALSTGLDVPRVSEIPGINVGSLKQWHEVIDWCFATYGPRAIAMKNQCAYGRRLDFEQVSAEEAAPLFERRLKDPESLTAEEEKAVQDHLFHYCVRKSVEYKLPVKLHTGYYAGHGHMPLHRVGANLSDLCPVVQAHSDAKFVVMHIAYPYQDEAIALAKHYPNVYIDLCWAWIINPAASVRFVKEFLGAAPSNKLLTFGGDFLPVELTVGHAQIARQGLAQAITELVAEEWLDDVHVFDLIERLMRGNAHALFDYEGTLANWNPERTAAAKAARA